MSDRCSHNTHIDIECADCLALENEGLRERVGELEKESEFRRALIERAYHAANKPGWEEGECLNEVIGDLRWTAIDEPAMHREIADEKENGDG